MTTKKATSVREITLYANAVLAARGLDKKGWTFTINNNRCRLGVCRYDKKTVEVSKFHLTSPVRDIRNTVLHEVAHAEVGPGHGHGPVWKRKALELGCNGQRCGVMEAPAKYIGTCPKCKIQIPRNRRPRQAVHVGCGASRALGQIVTWRVNNV